MDTFMTAIPTADAEFSTTVVLIAPQPVGAGHEQNYPKEDMCG